MTYLPAPQELALVRLNEMEVAEMIEHHVDFVDQNGRSVHLPMQFVRHFVKRNDSLPRVFGIAQLPFILPDGTLHTGQGLDRKLGLVFRVPLELDELIPQPENCSPSAVARAMQFLTDEWLCDVACDYTGKCILVAFALTILQRLVLPERPAFFIIAGQRGSGKTTTAHMIVLGTLGHMASACAWSSAEEERRKSLFAFLSHGYPLVFWDNIPRGSTISCPSIERSLTSLMYTDRVLGVSEIRTVPATTVQAFTGNNVAPRGDLASRALCVRLGADRPDPENRQFRHPEPFAWTNNNRGEILQALYTVLLGNPRIRGSARSPAETRFKMWWNLVGAAVEHAACQHAEHVNACVMDAHPTARPTKISFRQLFSDNETDEEQSNSLATVLEVIHRRWPDGARATAIAAYCACVDEGAIEFKAALEHAAGKAIKVITATVLTWRLKAVTNAPVQVGEQILALSYLPDSTKNGGSFVVKTIR